MTAVRGWLVVDIGKKPLLLWLEAEAGCQPGLCLSHFLYHWDKIHDAHILKEESLF